MLVAKYKYWQFSLWFDAVFSCCHRVFGRQSFLLLLLSSITIVMMVVPINSHAKLASTDFTLSVDISESNNISIDEIDKVINSQGFTQLDSKYQSAKGSPWLKVEWNKDKVSDEKYLINNFTSQAYENYYLIKDNQVLISYTSGLNEPFNSRPIKHFKFVADVSEADYVLVKTCCNPGLPIYFELLNDKELNEDYYHELIWFAVVYSLIGIMIAYNFFISVYLREYQYLFYCYYLLSVLVILLSLSGIGKQFFWDGMPYVETFIFMVGLNVSIASVLFQMSFLEQKYLKDSHKKMMMWVIGLHFLVALFYFLGFYIEEIDRLTNILVQIIAIMTWLPMNYIIIRNILAGDQLAKILLFGYMLINIAGAVYVLRYNGYIPDIAWTDRTVDIAVLIEALILSVALAKKIQILREEKSRAEEAKTLQQQQFSKQLLTVQEKEKRQLSSALHDNFTHQLLILRNNIKNKLGAQSDESLHVDDMLNEIRTLSHFIHPHLLEKLGLQAALSHIFNEAMQTYGLDINFSIENIPLTDEQSIIIYRIVQEALNNIIQHANATECLVAISTDDQQVNILIKDDGDGFDSTSQNNGLGLTALAERCQMLSGSHKIHSDDDGTEIRIEFPYINEA